MTDRLRWGIIGTGNIARQFATGVRASRRGTVTAVGSRHAATAQAFAREFEVPRALGSYQEVLESRDVDVIYVSLPNSMHREWSEAALAAGKHVLCEKPLARSAAEARQMFDAARRSGKVLMEAFMYRSHPQTLAVIETVRSGAIGPLKLIRTSFCYRTRRIADNIRFSRALAGGALMDVGCYCINFSRALAGAEPVRTDAVGHVHESGVDDFAGGTLLFPQGLVASFTCGMMVQADNTAYLCGSEGYIEVPVPWKPGAGTCGFAVVRGTPPRMDAGGRPPAAAPPREPHAVSAPADPFTVEADDFAATLLDGKPPRVTAADSLGNMCVLDALRRQLGVFDDD